MRPLHRSAVGKAAYAVVCVLQLMLVDPAAAQDAPGRIAGQVINGATGRPVASAIVRFVPTEATVLTTAEGRYRSNPLPPGVYTVSTQMLGYANAQIDSVVVASGEVTLLNIALETSAIALEGIEVETQRTGATASENALLATRAAAATVSDGISAEEIGRSSASDAGDAIARVTGVSVVDGKFVVVRGLAERYSNTLLNGSEISSPEPEKRIVPFDIFPASLLESVVTTKAATPDRPGDFAGGSVDIKTKEFPEQDVLEMSLSFSGNSTSTFLQRPFIPRSGADFLGFDGQNRRSDLEVDGTEEFAESLRNVWTPDERTVLPNFGFGIDWGKQFGDFDDALGVVLSVDYGLGIDHDPDEIFAFFASLQSPSASVRSRSAPTTSGTNWGVVGNISKRFGANHKISLKNLVTRETEEFVNLLTAFDPEVQTGFQGTIEGYQIRYIERTSIQSQLSGRDRFESLLGGLDLTVDWKGTIAQALRDEPENRTLNYLERENGGFEISSSQANPFWFRFLDETTASGQLDLSVPFSTWDRDDALVKVGTLYRDRRRDFNAFLYNVRQPFTTLPDPGSTALPPEELFTPENIGRNIDWVNITTAALPYEVEESVFSAYLMLDIPILPGLRAVGGLRREQWNLNVFPNSKEEVFGEAQVRDEVDNLLSLNLTYSLADDQNLRAAVYQTVSRPDPRELTDSRYTAVSGRCDTTGNADLNLARIFNSDVRWEWFPGAGELISASVFYKSFVDPIVVGARVQSLSCIFFPFNATSAVNFGTELEVRKGLGFVADALENFSTSLNFTFTEGDTDAPDDLFGNLPNLPLQDQSNFLVNGGLSYNDLDSGLDASLLFSWVGERVRRYGIFSTVQDGDGTTRAGDVRELARGTLDLKVSKRLGDFTLSLSGRNLTDTLIQEVQESAVVGDILVGRARPGVDFSLGLTYAF